MNQHKHDNLKYPECCWVDTAFGSVENRNKIKKVTELVLPEKSIDCYCSIMRFQQEFRDRVAKTGSVKGCDKMLCYTDHLWFDIDDNNLEKALETSRNLLFQLDNEFNLPPSVVEIYFSGKKGFHVGIPAECIGWEPSVELPKIIKAMACKIAGKLPIDKAIYDKTRLLRLSGSIHSGSNLHKVRLNPEQLCHLDSELSIEDIKKQAKDNTQYVPRNESTFELNPVLHELYQSSKQYLEQTPKAKRSMRTSIIMDKPCIQRLLGGVGEGQRNEAAARIADHYIKRKYSLKQVEAELSKWNHHNQPPLAENEIQAIVSSINSGGYDYGCNDPVLKSVCSDKCSLKLKKKDLKENILYTSYLSLPDGSFIEMLYVANQNPKTRFARFYNNQIDIVDSVVHPHTGQLIKPFKADKIIESGTVRFPSAVEEYGSEKELLTEIEAHISRYLIISPHFIKLASVYVLLSWVYDNYSVLPYLRTIGDYGTGKSRFLQVIGSICYKPIFTNAAATVSPIFRLIDKFKGTMIIDEADFTQSDDSARIIKILNCGYQEGFPVVLSLPEKNDYSPTAFDVYCPKLIASRREFKDRALESRCITESMDGQFERGRVPLNLQRSFWDEALMLRNELLMFRFRKIGKTSEDENIAQLALEPRLAQVMMPIAGIIEDEVVKQDLIEFVMERNQQIIEERGESMEGKVARAVIDLYYSESDQLLTMKRIADEVNDKYIPNARYPLTARKVGSIVRRTFKLVTERGREGISLVSNDANETKLKKLAPRYGLDLLIHPEQCSQRSQCSSALQDNKLEGEHCW